MRRWVTVMILTCAVALLAIRYVHDQSSDLESLASVGAIQNDAPVQTSQEIVILAPAEKVWSALTDIDRWPSWQSDIKEASIAGPLQSGTSFTWTLGSTHIQSKLALVEANRRIAWTGSARGARAVHVWTLQKITGNKTRLKMDESISGWLLPWLYSSQQLEASDRVWLECLKKQAER